MYKFWFQLTLQSYEQYLGYLTIGYIVAAREQYFIKMRLKVFSSVYRSNLLIVNMDIKRKYFLLLRMRLCYKFLE